MSRDPRLFLDDILVSASKVFLYTKDMSQEAFEANEMAYDAVLRNLEIIGEAAKQIPRKCGIAQRGFHGGWFAGSGTTYLAADLLEAVELDEFGDVDGQEALGASARTVPAP